MQARRRKQRCKWKRGCQLDQSGWWKKKSELQAECARCKRHKLANLPAENISGLLSEHTSGVYFGWARLSTRGIFKMVMSIGWNPYFNNTEKTVVVKRKRIGPREVRRTSRGRVWGSLVTLMSSRAEANFPSLESLIQRIHEDGRIAEKALDLPTYAGYWDDPYLNPRN
ncbi:hypothetical protein KSP40_PGU013772 [Platanthera guangdongensis]|uniref:riboflavin kinase n=1 Tax=Platanthera guangdongensis TaxID=2320717 RepID=A0ABR2LSU2_9ASPA